MRCGEDAPGNADLVTKQVTREQLFDLVWSSPVSKVAPTLGLSDVGLAKRCKREGVPLPSRGYWAKVAAGHQQPPRPPLPAKPEPKPTPKEVAKVSKPATGVSAPAPEPKKSVTRRRVVYRLPRGDRLETFWCKLDRWERRYSFGVNWRLWEYNDKSWSEYNYLELFATIRSKSARPYPNLQVSLYPTYVPRERINPELDAIGNVWTDRQKKGWLCCSAFLLSDAFDSMCNAVGRNEFQEIVVEVHNLSRGRGSVSEISFNPRLADLSDDE